MYPKQSGRENTDKQTYNAKELKNRFKIVLIVLSSIFCDYIKYNYSV